MKPTPIKITIALILFSLLAISCGRSKRQRLAVAYVIDMTASVDSEAIRQAFAAIHPLLKSKTLQRGDSITIIPITGDTLTESQGKILRIHLPENREVYDSDLVKLASEVEEQLERIQSEATANPYQHSDILGAIDLAAEELATEKGNVRKVIVILSDFIQDDSRFNFNTLRDLANDRAAVVLAKQVATKSPESPTENPMGTSPDSASTSPVGKFSGTDVYLGMLRSKDLKKMPNARREAVQIFWREYFRYCNAQSVGLAIDGPGKIVSVIERTE
jgi:hypothetical protein